MSIIQEIHSWSQSLPEWQQDAIARLYANRTLEPQDLDDLLALAMSEHGIDDPNKRIPSKLAVAQLAAPPVPNRLVQLTGIKDLRNVNALAPDHRLPIAPTGFTLIFGENGVGKSGYSRVLKQACRARDRSELILPDMRVTHAQKPVASAVFEVLVDGQSVELAWTFGQESPEQLSEIALFDSHCARAYVDNDGDFAYAPYGLDILEGLVKACNAIKAKVLQQHSGNRPNLEPLAPLARTTTEVGRLLSTLSDKTRPEDVERLATLSDAELERLATLGRALVEADPKQKAQVLKLKASRFRALVGRVTEVAALITDEKVGVVRGLIEKSRAAKEVADAAARSFREQPGRLRGTGSEAWQVLLEAARTFAAESHAGHALAQLPPDSACPLCQNPLGEAGSGRLAAFDAFIRGEAEKLAKSARTAAVTAYQAVEQAALELRIDEALGKELNDVSADLAAACGNFQSALLARKSSIIDAGAARIQWEEITPLPPSPSDMLLETSTRLEAEARTLTAAMDEKARAAMISEHAELDARKKLGELRAIVLESIEKLSLCNRLKACADSIVTTGISRKSTDLSRTMATQEVADALNQELRLLDVHTLRVAMKPESPGGRTQLKLVLELPAGGNASDILSEGEQRAIAIASFLTEVKLGRGRGGIVFDDPVSSLDHARRERVATRLAQEARSRQVIVLTHDLYFLNVLMHEARKLSFEPMTLTLRRGMQGYGVVEATLPFEGASTRDRVGQLRQMQVDCARFHKVEDQVNYRRAALHLYSHLRMSWERAVEELLFQGVVLRFRKGVETSRLKRVVVTPEDIQTVEQNMTKCSTFTGHDGAMDANPAIPLPDEIAADIEALETWRKSTDDRAKKIK